MEADLPVEIQENIISQASIESLKGFRTTSKNLKVLADREIAKRYLKIHRPDDIYQGTEQNISHMIQYLTHLEEVVVKPAIAAGPNGSQEQRDFLSGEIRWADYPTLRYLLERGAVPTEELIDEYNILVDPRQRHNPKLVDNSAMLVALALKYGLNIHPDCPARYVLLAVHSLYRERNLDVPAWVPANPNEWPAPVDMDFWG